MFAYGAGGGMNKGGKLSITHFDRIDKGKDGVVTETEHEALLARCACS